VVPLLLSVFSGNLNFFELFQQFVMHVLPLEHNFGDHNTRVGPIVTTQTQLKFDVPK
jgi:hypothetical protein